MKNQKPTQLQIRRREQFLPNGIPKYVRIYDNNFDGNGSADNFTIVFTGRGHSVEGDHRRWHTVIAMSAKPYHPQGICLHEEYAEIIDRVHNKWPPSVGKKNHLGKRILFSDLPLDCQEIVLQDYIEYWNLV